MTAIGTVGLNSGDSEVHTQTSNSLSLSLSLVQAGPTCGLRRGPRAVALDGGWTKKGLRRWQPGSVAAAAAAAVRAPRLVFATQT